MKIILSLLVFCFVSTTLLLAQTADEKAVAAAVRQSPGAPIRSQMLSQQHPVDTRMLPLLLDHPALPDLPISEALVQSARARVRVGDDEAQPALSTSLG